MRIAQVAPLHESVPPKLYGGTERVVSYLTEELAASGHDVTLFASGDSVTRARLIAPCPRALRLDPECLDRHPHHAVLLDQVAERAGSFDVIHYHVDYHHFPLSRRLRLPNVTTLHGRLDIPDLIPLFRHFPDMPVISISQAQRAPLPWIRWVGTVHHGLPRDLFHLVEEAQGYLAVLGRISPEKGVDHAIEIARRAGLPLKIAAKVDPADQGYYEQAIRPLLGGPGVEFVGEIDEHEKQAFLGGAHALLFPIDWPEPFGLVLIEALACGTPVIAYHRGSVPEVLTHGVTGFVVHDVAAAADAVERVPGLSRARIRRAFEERYTAERMAADYVAIYERAAGRGGFDTEAAAEPATMMRDAASVRG